MARIADLFTPDELQRVLTMAAEWADILGSDGDLDHLSADDAELAERLRNAHPLT